MKHKKLITIKKDLKKKIETKADKDGTTEMQTIRTILRNYFKI